VIIVFSLSIFYDETSHKTGVLQERRPSARYRGQEAAPTTAKDCFHGSQEMIQKPLFSLLLAAFIVAAAGITLADADSHRQAVEKLFKLTQMEQRVNEGVDNVLLIQLQQSPQLEPHRQALNDFLQKHIGWNSMKDEIAAMYMEAFTEQELNEMNAFYITPTGQRVITDVPQLVQRRNQLAMRRMQENIGELQKLIAPQSGQ
jgi:hypothetical protein